MKQLLFIIALCFFGAIQPVSAQFGKLLNKAIERKTQEKADKEIDKAIDAAFKKDSVSVKSKDGKMVIDTPDSEVTFEEDNGSATNVAPSKFIGSYTSTTVVSKNNKQSEEPIEMQIFVDSYQVAMIIAGDGKHEKSARTIFDRRDRTMTTLTDEDGTHSGIKMKMPKTKVVVKNPAKQQTDVTPPKPIRTNQTRQISGYTCTKYTMSDYEMDYEFWVAEDINIDSNALLDAMNTTYSAGGANAGNNYCAAFGKGMVIETIMRDKEGKKNETMTTTISNLKIGSVDKSKFSTEGYAVQDMSIMNIFKGGK